MLFRFQIALSDIDRGVYESLDFRVAQHPSETFPYLLSRVLAFCLAYQEQLEFSPEGLADPETPALWKLGFMNSVELWIEVGNPSARKLHKATKTAKEVMVFTYKNPEVLIEDIKNNKVHRSDEIQITAFDPKFLEEVAEATEKNNPWTLLIQQNQLDLTIREKSFSTEIKRYRAI